MKRRASNDEFQCEDYAGREEVKQMLFGALETMSTSSEEDLPRNRDIVISLWADVLMLCEGIMTPPMRWRWLTADETRRVYNAARFCQTQPEVWRVLPRERKITHRAHEERLFREEDASHEDEVPDLTPREKASKVKLVFDEMILLFFTTLEDDELHEKNLKQLLSALNLSLDD